MCCTPQSQIFQGWEFAYLLICSDRSNQMSDCEQFAQIAQDKWATVSKLFRSLMLKEQPWVNRSGRSWQINDHEQFAQVAHDKWANEQFAPKIWLKLYFWYAFCMFKKNPSNSLIPSFFMSDLSKSLRSLTNNEQFEQIAQVAHQKWVNMIDSLRSLTKNERPLANHSGCFLYLQKIVINVTDVL